MTGRRHLLGRIAGALVDAALVSVAVVSPKLAQMPRDSLQILDITSTASMSLHEEARIAAEIPLIGGFDNLVVFDQRVAQNSLASILADLATGWQPRRDCWIRDLRPACNGADDDDQQPLQRLAHGRRAARLVAGPVAAVSDHRGSCLGSE